MHARLIHVETLLANNDLERELDELEMMQEQEEQRAARATRGTRRRPYSTERARID
jgi:hypothetical protein